MSAILKGSGLLLNPFTLPVSLGSLKGVLGSVSFLHTSPTMEKHRNVRKGLRVPKMTPKHIEILKNMHNKRPYWHKPVIVPTSPLSRTAHPKNQFEAEDRKIQEEILAKSTPDEPIDITEFSKSANLALKDEASTEIDPYCREPMKCILCPKRYAVDYIRPSWKNPKLLAQFVSPHTGLTYAKHITGLCESMQQEVEKEVKRAQKMGYMATKIKEIHYLKDPPLFDPARPKRKNPY